MRGVADGLFEKLGTSKTLDELQASHRARFLSDCPCLGLSTFWQTSLGVSIFSPKPSLGLARSSPILDFLEGIK